MIGTREVTAKGAIIDGDSKSIANKGKMSINISVFSLYFTAAKMSPLDLPIALGTQVPFARFDAGLILITLYGFPSNKKCVMKHTISLAFFEHNFI